MAPRVFTRRLLITFVIAALILPLSGSVVSSQGYVWTRTVTMLVPAVAETPQGYIGVSSRLVVTVAYPGHGVVYFAAEPLTQLDTQAAARIAAIVAAMLAGVDFYSYDYFIHLEANSTIVGGPSASGAMAVAILAALRGYRIPSNFSMTGMVDPDITLGPVGGIPEKLEAMARSGVKVFVVPAGQSIALDLNTGRYVNVTALGTSLGVRVVEADTILDAYVLATGDKALATHVEKLAERGVNIYSAFPLLRKNLAKVNEEFAKSASKNLTCAEKLVEKLDPAVRGFVNKLIAEAKEYLLERKTLEKEGLLYSAASRAFGAAIDSTIACSVARAFSANNTVSVLEKQVETYLQTANNTISIVMKRFNKFLENNKLSIVELQLAIAVKNRIDYAKASIDEAHYYLSAAKRSTGFASIEALLNALQDAIYSYYRAITANQWLNLLSGAANMKAPAISMKRIIGLAENYYYIASSAATYLQALAASAGAPVSPPQQLAEAQRLVSSGAIQHNLSAALKLIALSITALANTAATIHKVFNVNTEKTLHASQKALAILIGLDIASNTTPILPSLYKEYASIQQEIDGRLSLYMQAASYAILLSTLAHQKAIKTTTTHPSSTTPLRQTTTITATVTKTKTTTLTKEHTAIIVETSTTTTKTTITSTKTVTISQPMTSYVSIALIALVIGIAIGYLIGRSRPL